MKMFAWAVVISHRHGDNVSVVLSRAAATEALVAYCKEWWAEVRDDPPIPDDPEELIEVYFDGIDLEFYNVVKCELDIPLSTDPLIREALDFETDAFENDTPVCGADWVDWFAQWRTRAKSAIGEKPSQETESVCE